MRRGALIGFDLAHAIGNLPLALHDWDVDFAVWCSYKYLNAGPGAIAGCFMHERHFENSPARLSGWWGHEPKTRFQMLPEFRPAAGAAGWAVSNPPIFSAAPLLASLEMFRAADIGELRAKSDAAHRLRRAADARALWQAHAHHHARGAGGARLPAQLPRQRRPEARPAHLRCAGRARHVCDWREPDIIRIAPVPLYNRFIDVFDMVEELVTALKEIA